MAARSILFFALGNAQKASSRVRIYWLLPELRALGYRCRVVEGNPRKHFWRFFYLILRHRDIVFQKSYSRYHLWLMRLASLFNKRFWVDIDDAPSRGNNPVTEANFRKQLSLARGVFAGSEALVDLCRQWGGKAFYLPTSVVLENYRVDAKRAGPSIVLGWIGNGPHYSKDLLEVLLPVLEDLSKRHSLSLHLVGTLGSEALATQFGAVEKLDLHCIDSLDWNRPEAMQEALAKFDIGLYPLLPDSFNQYKCGFKALEYQASGLPLVASANRANAAIVEHGVSGFLASSSEEWKQYLSALIENPELRLRMGLAGRKRVEQSYSVETAARRMSEIISDIQT